MTLFRAIAVAALFAPASLSAAPIDDAIMAARPCEAIPGFDETRDVRLLRFDLTVRRELVTVRAEGDIDCAASGAGLFRGNLSARAIIEAEMDSETCELTESTVTLGNIGGTAAVLLAPRQSETEELLSALLGTALVAECGRMLGR